MFPANSVLMVGIGATVGKVGYVEQSCYANQQINAISFNKQKVLPKYGAYWLLDKKEEVNRTTPSVTLPICNQSKVRLMVINYPSLSEQQRIVEYLDVKSAAIDLQVTQLKKKWELYERLKTATINRAVTRGFDDKVCMKDSGVEWIGRIPEHWKVSRLKNHAKIVLGKMIMSTEPLHNNGEYTLEKYLKARNIGWLEVSTAEDEVDSMWFNDYEKSIYKLHDGDIVMNEGGDIGKVSLWHGIGYDCYIQNSVNKITPTCDMNPAYLAYFLYHASQQGYFWSIVTQISIAHLTKEKLSFTPILCPIFSVVEEMGYTCYIPETKEKLYGFRPDLTFFVNGIYIGYAELKSNFNHQLARTNGRGKVMGDYLQAVKAYAQIAERNDASQRLRKATLHVFEKAIHLVATDVFDTYVLRGVEQLTSEFRAGFYEQRLTFSDCQTKLKQVFKPYPVSSDLLTPQQKFEEVMRALYDKKMIEREILYYNFMKYEYKKENGQKVYKDKSGTLISPRPKQKYGTDKILRRVSEYLEHEAEPDYFENQLRQQLIQAGATKEQVERTIQERRAYCNNKYVFSLLMQYAPGFGKSNIIGWTALLLKDLRHNGQWTYDKIIIVVDRLQLRDQMETMMRNMNIDKAMYVEAKDADGFVNALAPDAAEHQMVCRYFHLLVMLKGVIDIPKEHKDKVFLDFWNHYNKMYCSLTKNKDLVLVLSDYDDEVGIIIKVDEEDAPPASPPSTTNPRKRRKRRGTGVQELVARLNLEQELTDQQIHLIAQEEVAFFDYLKRQGKLMAMIRGNSHERKEIEREFKKQMNMYIRLNNEKTEICRLLTGNAEFFFDRFLDAVDDSHGQTHHFNYAAWKEMRGYAQAAEASDDNP